MNPAARLSAACMALLMLIPAAAPLIPADNPNSAMGNPKSADGWWSAWERDADRNGMDDRLEARIASCGAGPYDIFVDYGYHPSERDLRSLDGIGSNRFAYRYTDTVAVWGASAGDIAAIRAVPGVVMVEMQNEYRPLLDVSVADLRARQSATYSRSAWSELNITGRGNAVGIIDTGVDNALHESLDDMDDNPATNDPKFVGGYDASGVVFVERDPDDNDGHGTHVAGTAVGTGGSAHTFSGVAPGARLVDIKVLNAVGTTSAGKVVAGIDWAILNKRRFNITVLSLSLGSSYSSNGNDTEGREVAAAVDAGIAVVVAIGNDGPSNSGIGSPGAADDAITVGATDDMNSIKRDDDVVAYYSSRGPRASDGDGDPYDELKPDVVAPGSNIMSAMANSGAAYLSMSGTSMAAPHISGVVALVREANPDLSPLQVRQILRETAEKRGTPYSPSLDPKYSTEYGWGVADAYGAVKRALDLRSGRLGGPQSVPLGSAGDFSANITLTRTEYTSTPDIMVINASVPYPWSRPTNVTVTMESGVAFTSSTGVVQVNGTGGRNSYVVTGRINVTGVVGAVKPLHPSLNFRTFPTPDSTPGNSTFTAGYSLNSIPGTTSSLSVQTTQQTGLRPDLYISSVAFSNTAPAGGQNISINATVQNGGAIGVAGVETRFYDGPPETGILIGTDRVTAGPAGSDTASVTWTAQPGYHKIHAEVDPANLVNETNETNNRASNAVQVSGSNAPPSALLSVSPAAAAAGDEVRFDGTGSNDTDGRVVLYNFDFGDGNSTGWATSSSATHSYGARGNYTVALTVQDNGGANSTSSVVVRIIYSRRSVGLYLGPPSNYALSLWKPPELGGASSSMPNGTNPLLPFAPAEWRTVGTWNISGFSPATSIEAPPAARLWVENTGQENATGVQLEAIFRVSYGSTTNTFENTTPARDFAAGAISLVEFNLSFTNRTQVPDGASFSFEVRVRYKGDSLHLGYWNRVRDSGVTVVFNASVDLPPLADAGGPYDVAGTTVVNLLGRGEDPDGWAARYMWDIDGDGNAEWNSPSGPGYRADYGRSGTFTAVFTVVDNEGASRSASVRVSVRAANSAPAITGWSPAGDVVMEEGQTVRFSVNGSDPDGDALAASWFLDGSLSAQGNMFYLFTPNGSRLGSHEIKAAVSDGWLSVSRSWGVTVRPVNHPPVIASALPAGDPVIEEGQDAAFTINASDPDGDEVSFLWTVNGEVVGRDRSYTFITDYTSVGTYAVSGHAIDALGASASRRWNLTVTDKNRLPKAAITTPPNGSVFPARGTVLFEATAYDADGDALTFSWTSNISGTVGSGRSVTAKLPEGRHRITLTVDDGKDNVTVSIGILVKAPKRPPAPPVPGFEGMLVVAGVAVAVALMGRRARR